MFAAGVAGAGLPASLCVLQAGGGRTAGFHGRGGGQVLGRGWPELPWRPKAVSMGRRSVMQDEDDVCFEYGFVSTSVCVLCFVSNMCVSSVWFCFEYVFSLKIRDNV